MRLKVDQKKCTGCLKCVEACKEATLSSEARIYVEKGQAEGVFKITYCTMCGICERVCPIKVIDRSTGVIDVDQNACVGCKVCYYMCPFGAIEMISRETTNYVKTVAQKCNLCKKNNFSAACAKACPTGAIVQVD